MAGNDQRPRASRTRPQGRMPVRVKLQSDLEQHDADADAKIPAGRWAWCKRLRFENGGWIEFGKQFRVWDPWNSELEGYQLATGDEAKAEYVRWGAKRYEFYDAPCTE